VNDAPAHDAEQVIKQLRDELARVEAERARLERERDRLRRENERLRKELDAARRARFRQAAPFSKGAPVPRPRQPGRKPGPATNRSNGLL
jgi:septal ring factor EnvC (AmiA/AmiB activator)